jgi:hypothetical protein
VADLAPYAPHIVPHKRDEMLCYCTVTSKVLHRYVAAASAGAGARARAHREAARRRKAELDAHVAGRRFRNELAQRKKAAEEGRELGDADAAAGGDEEAAGGDGEDAEEEEGEEEEDEEDGGVRAAGRHVSFAARAGAEDDGEEEEEGDEEENGEEEEGNEEEEADEAEENGDEEERGAGAGAATERKGPVPAAASSSFGFDEVPADWKAARPAGDSSSSDDERPAPSRKRVPDARAASRGPAKRARTAAQ